MTRAGRARVPAMAAIPVAFTVAAAAVLAWLAPASRAQDRQFRAGTDTVPVFVTVRDRDGAFVLDLTKDEFELEDNGAAQTITQFTTDVQPLRTMILIDGSSSMMAEFDRAIEGASSFIVRMLPHDRTRVGSFADGLRFGPRFTSDRDELLAFLADQFNLIVGSETHLWEAMLEGTIALGSESGKRVVLALSDGYNFVLPPGATQNPGGMVPGGGGRGPTGTRVPPGIGNPLGGRPPVGAPVPGRNPTIPTGPMGDPATTGVPMDAVRSAALSRDVIVYAVSMWTRQGGVRAERPNRDLERLAIETGGGVFQVRLGDDMTATFGQIVQELRRQYVLGFTPRVLDGRTHRIDVRAKRPGLQVNARRSYIASREPR